MTVLMDINLQSKNHGLFKRCQTGFFKTPPTGTKGAPPQTKAAFILYLGAFTVYKLGASNRATFSTLSPRRFARSCN